MNNLQKEINKYIIKALELTRDEIVNVIALKVLEYYSEDVFSPPDKATPDYYVRTHQMANELKKSDVTPYKSGFEFWCGWDDEYLNFRYDGGFVAKGRSKKYDAITGEQVLKAFDSGTHGYTVKGQHRYWQESLSELGGEKGILELFKKNCIKVGLPIK